MDKVELGNELCAAALAGDLARATVLLEAGADPGHIFVGDECLRGEMQEHLCWPGNTPLADAIRAGQAPMVRFLLENGADPNAPVAAAFGAYPNRVRDTALTWWMRFSVEYNLNPETGESQAFIRPGMLDLGSLLLLKGCDPAQGATTPGGTQGPGVDHMMALEGLGPELERMRAMACRDGLMECTHETSSEEKARGRL